MKNLVFGVALAPLLVALFIAFRPNLLSTSHATPVACVDDYLRAIKSHDENAYLNCLTEPVRTNLAQAYGTSGALASELRVRGHDLQGWTITEQDSPEGNRVGVWVDERHLDGPRRARYLVEYTDAGWLIIERQNPLPAAPQPEDLGQAVALPSLVP